jgi:protoheme IX farnesyltransferase
MMFAIIFLWTPPHFWALSLWANADYARVGVPMLPVVSGARTTRRHIMAYTLLLLVGSLLPWATGLAGPVYGLSALVLGLGFVVYAWRVLRDRQDGTGVSLTNDVPAKAAFKYSIIYLFVLFAALAVDRLAG